MLEICQKWKKGIPLSSNEKTALYSIVNAPSFTDNKDECSMAMYTAFKALKAVNDESHFGNTISVRTITWNMGENQLSQKEWERAIIKDWPLITDQKYDILILCLQEDWNGPMGRFGNAVENVIASNYDLYQVSSRGPPDISGKHFAVKLFVFCKKGQFPNLQTPGAIKEDSMCLTKKLGLFCSKATVGLSLMLKKDVQFIALASHFPIKTDQPSLGYAERVRAVQESLNGVYNNLVHSVDGKVDGVDRDKRVKNLVAVWAGDMNFRANMPADNVDAPVPDQLAYAMSKGVFNSFTEVGQVTFPPTCKLKTCKKGQCPTCRARSGEEHSSVCYQTETANGPRPESFCDRILVYSEGKNVTVKTEEYNSWSAAKEVQNSDHNLVYAALTLLTKV